MKRTAPLVIVLLGILVVAAASPGTLRRAERLLADIGVGATVPATPTNTLNQQLDERAKQLDAREAALNASADTTAIWIALSVVAGLVAVNFILDWRRNRS